MIKNVYIFQNGMVMVFDDKGQQMSDYQGCWIKMREKIIADGSAASFYGGDWREGKRWPVDPFTYDPPDQAIPQSLVIP